MIGEVIGSYRIVSRIGAGGMGEVWLAEHHLLGSKVAIKVLLPEMSRQRKIVQRFFDEARAATRIQDPGIVAVLDFGWRDDTAYLVMEYLVGETLATRLDRLQRMPAAQALRILQLCALAMGAAHARGIIHRDLKPDNIFLVADPAVPGGERVKILDFGIAKLLGDNPSGPSTTQTGAILGTPAFMSPEQCRGAGSIDHRTDIYALGCVLFEMVCGRPPFVATTTGEMIACHLRETPPAPSTIVSGLPAPVDALAARCLEKEPAARFASMTELARTAAAIGGETASIHTMPPMRAPPGEAVTVPDRRRRPPTADTAPATTTLEGSTGQSAARPRPPRRRGLAVVFGLATILVATAATIAVRRYAPDEHEAAPAVHPAAAPPAAHPADPPPAEASAAPPPAEPAVPPPAASPPAEPAAPPPADPPPPAPVRPIIKVKRPGTKHTASAPHPVESHATAGSAAPAPPPDAAPYNPYDER